MATKKFQASHETVAHLFSLAERELTDEEAPEQWLEAETVIDYYIAAVEAGSADLPDRLELGEACFTLTWMAGIYRDEDHARLISDLLTPEVGIGFYNIFPEVMNLRIEAISAMEAQAKAGKKIQDTPSDHFEDLF